MKQVRFFIMMCLIITSSLLLFSSCKKKNSLHMDTDKCAEVALEYMEDKYQTEFEVLKSRQIMRVYGPAGFAEITVRNKSEDTENEYVVTVYPDGSVDGNKDGYYDLYQVISDDYMSHLLYDYAKNELEKLITEAGLMGFISNLWIEQMGLGEGSSGFSADFPVLNEESFSLKDIFDNYKIGLYCWFKMPESEYSEMLQDNMTNIIKPLVSDDLVTFTIDVYKDKYYSEIEGLDKNNIEYSAGIGERSIYFSIKEEEDKNESK